MYQSNELSGDAISRPDLKLPAAFVENIIASSPASVVVIEDTDFRVAFCNDQFSNIFGYTSEDVADKGFSFLDLFEEFQSERFKAHLRNVADNLSATKKYVVYRLINKNGECATTYIYASPVGKNDETYRHYYHLLLMQDLSEWPLPFTSFDTREIFLEQFSKEAFGTFEWIVGKDRVFWSEGVYKVYELDKSVQDIDFDFTKRFTHPADKERIEQLMTDAITNGTDINMEMRIVTAKQNIKTIHALGKTIRNSDGQVIKFVGSIRDVTEQRAIESDLRNNVEELNRSNKELEEFAYVASHDMQEPLRKITTFSDRLGEKYKDVLDGDGAMYLERMMASAENMRTLINNLLEFSRVVKSTQPFTTVNLNFILHQVKNDLELGIEETGTVINGSNLPTIDASMTQMKQLFTNILNNAIKFRKTDVAPVINIEAGIVEKEEKLAYNLQPGRTYFKIQITDNGIGFESEYATRIFQVFQRLHGKSEYPGSGIGLAICKKIVERHGGIIYAESLPGDGARFSFLLPEKQESVIS